MISPPRSVAGFPQWVQKLEKGPHGKYLLIGIGISLVVTQIISSAYLSAHTYPKTMTPENEAKHIAWMKFNNVNPVFGALLLIILLFIFKFTFIGTGRT